MTVGFIGFGNMSAAIIGGALASGFLTPSETIVFDPDVERTARGAADLGIEVASSNEDLVSRCDTIVLAIKPQMFAKVLPPLADLLAERGTLLVSIAAGTPIAKIEDVLGSTGVSQPIVRVMPNVNAMIGAGMAAVAGNSVASQENVAHVIELFNAVGMAIELPEESFSMYTAIAGSAPAYAFLFIDALSRGALKAGMPKELATKIAAQTVLGSAKMILESGDAPWVLIDKVCSPGGTTIAGLMALEDGGFVSTVVDGVEATIARDQELNAQD